MAAAATADPSWRPLGPAAVGRCTIVAEVASFVAAVVGIVGSLAVVAAVGEGQVVAVVAVAEA